MRRGGSLRGRYGGTSNVNLVLGADILRGVYRKPSVKDFQTMHDIGLRLN